jgi:hypothetical protein
MFWLSWLPTCQRGDGVAIEFTSKEGLGEPVARRASRVWMDDRDDIC